MALFCGTADAEAVAPAQRQLQHGEVARLVAQLRVDRRRPQVRQGQRHGQAVEPHQRHQPGKGDHRGPPRHRRPSGPASRCRIQAAAQAASTARHSASITV